MHHGVAEQHRLEVHRRLLTRDGFAQSRDDALGGPMTPEPPAADDALDPDTRARLTAQGEAMSSRDAAELALHTVESLLTD